MELKAQSSLASRKVGKEHFVFCILHFTSEEYDYPASTYYIESQAEDNIFVITVDRKFRVPKGASDIKQ